MVNMGMQLEDGVREGRLSKEETSTSKKYGGNFSKKKEGETNAVPVGRKMRPPMRKNVRPRQHHHQVSSVTPIFTNNPANQSVPVPQQHHQQQHAYNNHYNNNQQNFERKKGAPGHDIENYYPLKHEVQKFIKSGMVSFEDCAPSVKANLLPAHGNASVNMVDGYLGNFRVFDVRHIRHVNPRGCVIAKRDIQKLIDEGVIQSQQSRHMDNDVNVIVPVFKAPERVVIQYDNSKNDNRSILSLVIRLVGPVLYSSAKVIPYKYNATMIENGQEVPLPTSNSVVSIAYVIKVTHSGRVFGLVSPKVTEDVSKKANVPSVDLVNAPGCQSGESSGLKVKDNDNDEVFHLIKKSEFNIVEQLLQTPSNIYVLSLLMNSEAYKEAFQKVLEQTYVENDVIVDQLSYQGAPMRYISVVVKAFEGSRKNVIGEVDLPVKIGVSEFQITFLVMDIHPAYNCLLGRPWIHEVGVVTSTLHQKLKFVKNGKLVIVGGEKALLVNDLSSFTYVEAEEEAGGTDKWGRVV
ncbi:uncharacterized protein LOC127135986 [Lathyrus oleraceus]|uniref:uncharacterized protein LOC127135986 n=1 Tax=Pisum sativum TaxID=3888 RepID=UPI0021D2EFA5|nr:uncharacterized protein LOC127135986 [Pisum sativum]